MRGIISFFLVLLGLAFAPAAEAAQSAKSAKSKSGYVSCVPYVRSVSAISVKGDAWMWWHNAAGKYQRGHVPAEGSVLVFERTRAMTRGHVALVRQVISSRKIVVDHANWAPRGGRKGRIETGVEVVDVSPDNDWTEVRVWYGATRDIGRKVYPAYGFIYSDGTPDPRPSVPGAKAERKKVKAAKKPGKILAIYGTAFENQP